MGEQTYRLVFEGQLQPGRDPEEVKRRLVEGLKVDHEKIGRLFSGQRLTRHHLSAEQARRFESVFRNAGAVCKILPERDLPRPGRPPDAPFEPPAPARPDAPAPVPAATGMACPKCGRDQPVADECAFCGVQVAKAAAARSRHVAAGLPRSLAAAFRDRVTVDGTWVTPDIPRNVLEDALLPFTSQFAVWTGSRSLAPEPDEEVLLVVGGTLHLLGKKAWLVLTNRKLLHAFSAGAHECTGFELAEVESVSASGGSGGNLRVNGRELALSCNSDQEADSRAAVAELLNQIGRGLRGETVDVPPGARPPAQPITVRSVRLPVEVADRRVGGAFAPEKKGVQMGVVGGLIMILIAVVWFVLGLKAGVIFYYPPVLAAIGLFALVKGLWQGNFSGSRYR